MANEFKIKKGFISEGDGQITGSLEVTSEISASTFSGSFVGDGSGLTGVGGGTTYFTESANAIALDTGATTRDVLEINTGTANTYGASSFTAGSIIVGDGNTIGGAGSFRRSAVIGQAHTVGNTGGLQYSLVAGQSLTVNGTHNAVLGNNMTVDGNYNLVGVAAGAVYGNYNSKLGYVNTIGASANPVNRTTTLGYNLTADGSDQILIGRSFSTDLSYANFKGIFFGMDEGKPSAGFFQDPTINDGMNFVVGGDQAMRSDLGVAQSGSGRGVFYMANWSDNRVDEPTSDMPDAVAMWAKDRTANVKGLIVKAENGGKSFIGDRIGANATTPSASLHAVGEGSTSATTTFLLEDSGSATELFKVTDDGEVTITGGVTGSSFTGSFVGDGSGLTGVGGGGSSLWTASGADIIYDTGNVGIGLTSPTTNLNIHDPNDNNVYLKLTHNTSGTGSSDGAFLGLESSRLVIDQKEGDFDIRMNGIDRIQISASGHTSIKETLKVGGGNGTTDSGQTVQVYTDGSTPANAHFCNTTTGYGLSNGMFLGVGTGVDLQGYMWMRENLPIKFLTNDTERMRLQASGELSIGVDSTAAKLVVRGTGSTAATTNFLLEDSGGTDLFKVLDDGEITITGGVTGSSFTGSFVGDGSGLTGVSATTYFTETANSIALDTGVTTRDVLEINTNNDTTFGGTYTIGAIVVGNAHTIGSSGNLVRRSMIGGTSNNIGQLGTFSDSIVWGGWTANTVSDNCLYSAGFGSGILNGDYNFLGGYLNSVYGNNNVVLGQSSRVGASGTFANNSIAIGNNAVATNDNQIVIGNTVTTNATYAASPGIYLAWGTSRPTTGFFVDPTIGQGLNFAIGGNNTLRTDVGIIQSGSGAGILYLANYTDNNITEPTSDMSDAVALWAKDRTANVKGLIVKAENGGKSWIGDRIGVNTTTPSASLHAVGEGSTSATTALLIEDSGSVNELFKITDDGAVYGIPGAMLAMTELTAAALVTHTVTTSTTATVINLNSDATTRLAKASFVAPPSGNVLVRIEFDAVLTNSATNLRIGLHNANASTTTPTEGWFRINGDQDGSSASYFAEFKITGLTPGTTYNRYFVASSDFSGVTIRASQQQTGAIAVSDLPSPLRIKTYDLGAISITSNPTS